MNILPPYHPSHFFCSIAKPTIGFVRRCRVSGGLKVVTWWHVRSMCSCHYVTKAGRMRWKYRIIWTWASKAIVKTGSWLFRSCHVLLYGSVAYFFLIFPRVDSKGLFSLVEKSPGQPLIWASNLSGLCSLMRVDALWA